MGFLDNIIAGAKTGLNAVNGFTQKVPQFFEQLRQPASQIAQNVPQETVGQATQPIQTASGQVQQPIQAAVGQVQQQDKSNAIVNAIRNSHFNPQNWADDTRHTIGNAFLGIGKTAFSNPNENATANILNGINSGIQNQIAYKNATNALQNNGFDTTGLSPYADYSKLTADKIINLGIQQRKQQIMKEIANAKDDTARLKLIMNGVNNGPFDLQEGGRLMNIYGLGVNNLRESNQTRRTNSQIELNKARIQQGQQKIALSKQKNAASSGVRQIIDDLNIKNKQERLKQNKMINEAMARQLGNGNNRGRPPQGRPLGQKSNNEKSNNGYSF